MINQPKLNLACGEKTKEGYCNIDKAPLEGVDAVMDLLDFPWPIESNSAEKIICEHFVEHIPHDLSCRQLLNAIRKGLKDPIIDERDGLFIFMDEVYRILKPEGYIDITSPYYSSETMWRDPTHCRAITNVTFFYFNKMWRHRSGLDHYETKSDFNVEVRKYELYDDMAVKEENVKTKGMRFNINVVANIVVRLTKY